MTRVAPLPLQALQPRPLVSVLVANYNYACWIERALESLRAQTYPRFEAIVCDDGSTDGSAGVVEDFASRDLRITLLWQPNAGMAPALNTAWNSASGALVALLDSDDEWLPERLERVVARFLRAPKAGMVTHPMRAVLAGGGVLKPRHPRRLDEGWLAPSMLQGREPALPPSSGLTFRREVAERVFPLPAHFRRCADKVAQDRAALLAPVAPIHQPLGLYRIHGANLTGLSGPCSPAELDRHLEFLHLLWEDRRAFIETWHGFAPDPAPWSEIESAHFHLASMLHGRAGDQDMYLRGLPSPRLRLVWRLLMALPRPAGRASLKLWWTENGLKRLFRNAFDSLRATP